MYISIQVFGEKRTGSMSVLITAISRHRRHSVSVWGLLVNNPYLCSPHRDSASSPGSR